MNLSGHRRASLSSSAADVGLPAMTGGALKLWRSAWGLSGLRATPGQTLSRVRAAGFDGLECSLRDLGDTQDKRAALVAAARDEGLAMGLSAYSSWPDYEGPADDQLGRSADDHHAILTHELEQARRSPP
jgi:sugar phosphate isomerase/epimerase